MQIKLLVSAAAIALVAGVGSASAADQLSTLKGVSADVMTPQDMAEVVGSALPGLHVDPGRTGPLPTGILSPAVLTDAGKPFKGNAEAGLAHHLSISGANRPGGRKVEPPPTTPGEFPPGDGGMSGVASGHSVVAIICLCGGP